MDIVVRPKEDKDDIIRVREEPDGSVMVGIGKLCDADEDVDLPPGKEFVSMKQVGDGPIYEVTSSSGTGHGGPARVTSPAFRDNWDGIFGGDEDDDVPEGVTWH